MDFCRVSGEIFSNDESFEFCRANLRFEGLFKASKRVSSLKTNLSAKTALEFPKLI